MNLFAKIIIFSVLITTITSAQTKNVGIGTTTPDASALLDLTATDMGLLIPRMTTAQRDAIASPSIGLLIYNTTENKFQFYYGGWVNSILTNAVTSLNGQTGSTQIFGTGATGTDFNISSAGNTHTFNIPDASAANRGLVTTGVQTIAGAKTLNGTLTFSGTVTDITTGTNENLAIMPNGAGNVGIGITNPTFPLEVIDSAAIYPTDVESSNSAIYIMAGRDGKSSLGFGDIDNSSVGVLSYNNSTNALSFKIFNSTRMYIKNTGNIGIGTTAPGQKLAIEGTLGILETGTGATYHSIFQGGDQGADITYTLPVAVGANGQVLTTDASGVLSWATPTAASAWNLTGNAGTTPGTNFIGTTDDNALIIKVNNQKAGEISSGENTSFGYQSFMSSTGTQNSAFGYRALNNNSTGIGNASFGFQALYANSTGRSNVAFGWQALFSNTTTSYNTAIGHLAGRYIADGATANETSSQSVYIGSQTKAGASGNANEIVIGYDAIGAGNNTATLGNTSIVTTLLRGDVTLTNSDNIANEIRFQEPSTSGANYVAFKSPILAADNTYTLPDAYPTSNGQVLSATTAGVLSWSAGGGSVTGTGTANYITKWTGATALGNSLFQDNGTTVSVNTALDAAYRFKVDGNSLPAILGQYNNTTGPNAYLGGATYGAYGQYDANHYGILGSSSYGVGAFASGSSGTHRGVYAQATTTTGSSGDRIGVYGLASGGAYNYGFQGLSGGAASSVNYGIYALANVGLTSYGVWGEASNASTTNNYGVYGKATGAHATGNRYGIYGEASGGLLNWAGYFDGNVKTTGTLTVGAYTLPNTDGTSNQVLATNGSGTVSWVTGGGGGLGGGGTADYIARWTGGTTLGNSIIRDNATTVGINNAPNASYRLLATGTSMTAIAGTYDGTILGSLGTSLSGNFYGAYGQWTTTRYGYLGSTAYGAYGQYDANHYGFLGAGTAGVYGVNNGTAANEYAVQGSVTGASGTNKYAVHGSATGGGTTNYGIYGTATGATNNWAGYFEGDVKTTGKLYILESTGNTFHTIFQAGDQGANLTYTLPIAQGGASTYLQNDGTGVLTWAAAGSGSASLSSLTSATAVNTLTNANWAQVWNWNTATTQNPMTLTANTLTTGTILDITSSSGNTSTNGLLRVANTGATSTGIVLRAQSNSTAGSGLTVYADGDVAIGTSTVPTSKLTVNGSLSMPIRTITVNTTLTPDDYAILVNANALTITLPSVATSTGRIYVIKRIAANGTCTIDPNGAELIDGAATNTYLSTRWGSLIIQCDGAAWYVLSNI